MHPTTIYSCTLRRKEVRNRWFADETGGYRGKKYLLEYSVDVIKCLATNTGAYDFR